MQPMKKSPQRKKNSGQNIEQKCEELIKSEARSQRGACGKEILLSEVHHRGQEQPDRVHLAPEP